MNGPHWIKQWIADLALLNDQFRDENGSVDFSALGREEYLFRMALITQNFSKSERARDIYNIAKAAYNASVENGKKGGRPPKNPDISATATLQGTDDTRTGGHMLPSSSRSPVRNPAQRRIRPPRSFEEVAEFADAQGLDYDDARLWWQRNFVERPGCDKDGVAFDNWKGALVNACRAEEAKRNG